MKRQIIKTLLFCVLFLQIGPYSGHPKATPKKFHQSTWEVHSKESAITILEKAERIENNDPSLSEILLRKVLIYAKSVNEPILIARSQLQIASILVTKTKYTDAMKVALQARELAEKLNADNELAVYYEIAGKIKTSTGDYSQSLEDLFKSLAYFDKLKDIKGTGRVLNAIGTVSYWQKDYDKAMGYYQRALSISNRIHDTILLARSINNVGVILMARKENEKALMNCKDAITLNQKSGQLLRVGGNLMNLGIIYKNMGKYKESMQNFQLAINTFNQFENYSNLALCFMDLGFYYEDTGDRKNCILNLQKAYRMAEQFGFKGIELESVTKLHDLYRESNMTDSAYKYSIIKATIKDSIEIEKSVTRLSIAELQYQYDKKTRDEKLNQQKKDFFVIIMILTLIAIIVIFILIISRQRQKTKTIALEQKNLKDEIEFKNKELTLNVMNLLKRNEFIIGTSRRLLDIKPDQQPENVKEEVIRIAKSLQEETDKETWEEFELRFKQVHSGFYDRLLSNFPELTPNELKMCGLLRLNLTTKEISELTGQRRETIEMARFRLRKHLGLTDSQVNLVTFLSKI